jgi:hypothetical protein
VPRSHIYRYFAAQLLNRPLLNACRFLLEPIARLMIRNGIHWAEFAEIAKQAFVKVARNDYGLQGRPTNTARVAMMIGLSRREVARVKGLLTGAAGGDPPPASRISQILTGWHVDPVFTDTAGAPAVLPANGEERSFASLLKRYAGDMPHGAITKEMEQLGLVVKEGGGYRVTARDYVRGAADPDLLRQASVALHDHAQTVIHNVDTERKGPAYFERMATRAGVPLNVAAEFRELIAEKAQKLLEEADAWLEQHASGAEAGGARAARARTGLGIYLIHDTSRGRTDHEN